MGGVILWRFGPNWKEMIKIGLISFIAAAVTTFLVGLGIMWITAAMVEGSQAMTLAEAEEMIRKFQEAEEITEEVPTFQ
jgi:hypothetical protein